VNDNAPLAREAWKSSFRSLGNRLVLNRIGGFSGCPTRFPRGNQKGSPSNIDVIAMRAMDIARLSAKCVAVGGKVHLVAGLTDHRPVVCELEVKHRKPRVVERKYKWNMRRVEKDPALEQVFNHRLHAELQNAPGGQGQESADDLLEFIATAITGTAEEVVGKVVHHAPKRWWSHEVHTAHNARTAVHRRLQKLEEGTAPHALMFKAMKAKNKEYRAAVSHSKKTSLRKMVASGKHGVHRAMAKASGANARDSSRFMGDSATLKWRDHDLKYNGRDEVAAGVSKFTTEVSAGDDLNGVWDQRWKEKVVAANDRTFQQPATGPSPISNLSYNAAIKTIKAKMKKAPGIDMVTNWMLVWGESALRGPLISLFENMWKNNVVPAGIAQARVAYIYKGKGPMAEISGYRPISLISCIGKLYTLLWLRPLVEQVSPHIGPAQGAFRKGTSAVEQAWAIMEMAHEQVGVGEADPHLMLTDLEKCYDGIWRQGLYLMLSSMGVEQSFLLNIRAWLENTVMHPEWNGVTGPPVTPKEGLKQGCVLSPILCIVFMNSWSADLPSVHMHPWVRPLARRAFSFGSRAAPLGWKPARVRGFVPSFQFCDDSTLLARSRKQMKLLFALYLEWCELMRLNVNIGKCSVTRLVKPASATQKSRLSLALDRWRFPIRYRKKQETKALVAWKNRRGTSPKPVAKPVPKSRGIEPFMHLKGKAVRETLSFRVLGHRDNFDLSGRASIEHADKVVSGSLWAVRWVRKNLGSSHALDYAASRVAPSALFAVEAGSTPVGYEALGNRVARAALGLEPSAGQKLPPNWCLLTTPKWVPWGCEVSLRSARLKWSLERAGSSTLPGRLHKLCSGRVLSKMPFQFRTFAPKMECAALSRRWVVQTKAKKAEVIRAKALVGSGTWWAIRLSSGGVAESLSPVHRRWRAAMFPFKQLSQARCPMCPLQNSNLHLAVDCKHREIQEAREHALQQMDTVMLDWHANGIPESWAQAWPQLSRAQQLVALIRADFSPGNRHLWTLVSDTLGAAWKQMTSAVKDKMKG
jgi:hypothetical protein